MDAISPTDVELPTPCPGGQLAFYDVEDEAWVVRMFAELHRCHRVWVMRTEDIVMLSCLGRHELAP